MIKHFFKVAIRNLLRSKGFSIINISGLSISITIFVLIIFYVNGELSADKFHKNADRIFRVERQEKFGITSITLFDRITKAIPEIEKGSRLMPYPGNIKRNDEIIPSRITFVDSTFFEIFSFEAASGDLTTALDEKNSMIIKESYATKLFGKKNPIGKEIIFRDESFTITAVMKDCDQKTQLFITDLMGNFLKLKDFGEDFENDWWGNYVTYVMLPQDMEPSYIQDKLDRFNSEMKEIVHESYPEHWLNPFKDLYFETGKYDHSLHGNILSVKLFLISALLIIMIACINFINLSTARAMLRAKEIGIRKVVGAAKSSLLTQFLGESVFISLLAGIISLILIYFFFPIFSDFFGMKTSLYSLNNYILFSSTILLIGLVSGVYPAFYLASAIPIKTLRSEYTKGKKGVAFRKVLTVLQFAVSIILVSGTLIVQKQLKYIQERNPGFNKEQIITFGIPASCKNGKQDVFRQELLKITGVKYATYTYTTPGRVILQWGHTDPEGVTYEFRANPTDPDYLNVFEIPLLMGENWSWEQDRFQGVIVNETFVKMMGWENPLKEYIWDDVPIRAVMKDFTYRTLHFEIEPLVLVYNWEETYNISLKLDGTNLPSIIDKVKIVFEEFEDENTFDYYFLDDDFARFYRNEIRFGKIFGYFSILAIFVACLGLFGLASFLTSQRIKEIGIRKVMGASVGNIIGVLSFDFIKWIVLSNLIAWPLCWYIMNNWLSKFAYHTEIGFLELIISGLIAVVISLITISYHTFRAATSNPVNALKYE